LAENAASFILVRNKKSLQEVEIRRLSPEAEPGTRLLRQGIWHF